VLFCSRSSGYRLVCLEHAKPLGGTVDGDGQGATPVRPTVLMPGIKCSLATLLHAPPRASGWGHTHAGAVPRWRSHSAPSLPLRGRRGRGGAGSMHAVGGGNGPREWPKSMSRSGASPGKPMRGWVVRMHAIAICGPKAGPRGGPRGARRTS
jgi:hypothetical protein